MKKCWCRVLVLLAILLSSLSYYLFIKPKKIKIGFVASLSGKNSQLGVNGRNALLMAQEEINSRDGIGGRRIDLVIKDNKSDPGTIQKIIAEFIEEDVELVIGPYTSNMAVNLLKAIDKKNILVLSPTVSTDKVSKIDDNFMRLIESAANQGQILAEKIVRDDNIKTAVVYDHSNADYTVTVVERMKHVLSERDLSFVYSSDMPLKDGTVDFVSIAKNIVSAGADSLVIVSNSIDAANLVQQVRKQGSNIQVYGSRWAKSGHIISDGGRAVEGMILVSNYSEKRKSGKFKRFIENYNKRYAENANFPQIYTYDAMYFIKQAIEEANSFDAKKIKEALIFISRFQGLDAVVEIDKYGDAWRPYAMVRIKNGVFEDID